MIKHLSLISVALLLAAGSASARAPGESFILAQAKPRVIKGCPTNDTHVPEGRTACRDGIMHECKGGEWRALGQRCTVPQR